MKNQQFSPRKNCTEAHSKRIIDTPMIMFTILIVFLIVLNTNQISAFDWTGISAPTLYYDFDSATEVIYGVNNLIDNEGSATFGTNQALIGTAGNATEGNNWKINSNYGTNFFNGSHSFNMWMRPAGVNNIYYIGMDNPFLINGITANKQEIHIGNLINNTVAAPLNNWQMVTGTFNGTGIKVYVNGTLIQTYIESPAQTSLDIFIGTKFNSANDFIGLIDEMGWWNITLNQTEIDELYNSGLGIAYGGGVITNLSVVLNTPANNALINLIYIDFNVTINTTAAIALDNSTLYIWDINGSIFITNVSLVPSTPLVERLWNLTDFVLGSEYTWNVKATGNDSQVYWASSNYTFTASAYSETIVTWNTSIYETTQQKFSQEISAVSSISSASAVLWYNGTSHVSTVQDLGGNVWNATNYLDIPLTNVSVNKTFFWEWTFTTSTQTLKQNSTTYEQEVNRTYLILCNATYTNAFEYITTKNATNPFPNLNTTFKSAWRWWLGNGTIYRNYSYENLSEADHTFDFCLSPVDKTFTLNSVIEVDGVASAKNYHYLTNASVTNTSTPINIYLLRDDLAALTVLHVRDGAQNPLENVYIQIQAHDVGTDTFYTVGMARTSFNGEDIAYLNWYDTFYKFILIKDGEIIKTTNSYKITETPQIFEVTTEVTFPYNKFEDFIYTLYYNNATSNFVLTFTKPSGLVDKGCLRVIKRSAKNDSTVCNVCETSSSATLYCNIASYGNGTYIATFYATGSLLGIKTIIEFIGQTNLLYDLIGNIDATAYAFLFSGIVLAMFFVSPVLAILGLLLGMLGGMFLGFQPLDYGGFIGIVLLGGVVIWYLNR